MTEVKLLSLSLNSLFCLFFCLSFFYSLPQLTLCHYTPELSLADLRATDISVYLWRSLLRHFLTPMSLSGTLKELSPKTLLTPPTNTKLYTKK